MGVLFKPGLMTSKATFFSLIQGYSSSPVLSTSQSLIPKESSISKDRAQGPLLAWTSIFPGSGCRSCAYVRVWHWFLTGCCWAWLSICIFITVNGACSSSTGPQQPRSLCFSWQLRQQPLTPALSPNDGRSGLHSPTSNHSTFLGLDF